MIVKKILSLPQHEFEKEFNELCGEFLLEKYPFNTMVEMMDEICHKRGGNTSKIPNLKKVMDKYKKSLTELFSSEWKSKFKIVELEFKKHEPINLLDYIPKLPQRQDSLTDQLKDLIMVANKLGLYNAADAVRITLLKDNFNNKEKV